MSLSPRSTYWLWLTAALLCGTAVALLPWVPLAAVLGTAVLGGLVLLLLWRPWVGLALALVLGPWGALENIWLGGNVPLDSGQLLLLLAIAAWVGRGLAQRRLIVPHSRFTWPLLALLGIMLLTLLDAPSAVLGVMELLKWVEMLLIIWLVADWARETADPQRVLLTLLAVILTAAVSQALIGIWQFGLRGHGPEHFVVLGRFYRAYGTYEQPNPFGGYMAFNGALALGATLGLLSHGWQVRPWVWLGLGGMAAVTAVLALALVMSWSRGAWLGFAAAVGLIAFFWPRNVGWGAAVVTVAAVGGLAAWQLGLLPPAILERVTTSLAEFRPGDVRGVDINDTNYAVLERLAFWQAAVGMANQQPWLGVGFGNYALAYPDYALINWPIPLGHAHNYYLNLLAETGLLGTAVYGLVWLYILWDNLLLLRRLTWPWRGVALGLWGAWIALSVHQVVDKLYVNNIYIHLGAMLGAQHLLGEMVRGENDECERKG